MAKVFNNLLLENGDELLLETGDSLLLENYYYWEALAIVVGNYTYTGFGVNFIKGRIMKVIVGLYSLSGSGLLFNRLRKL